MKIMMKVSFPVETGNALAKNGTLGDKIKAILEEQKPDAAYFTDIDGERGGYIFLDINDGSDIPKVAEPWFLSFNAEIELKPVMTPEDLGKASDSIKAAVSKYS